MNNYVTGKLIKKLREGKKITQLELANILNVTDKAISKWETGNGLPDITLIEPLATALGVSVIELMKGENITNNNIASNMLNSKFYVCPICGNVIHTIGENVVSCCGIVLPILEAEIEDKEHRINCELVENEYYITLDHSMTKQHYISFIAYITNEKCEFVKLYPEQSIEVRFLKKGRGIIYVYCNKDGLYRKNI
ncbi:MAG TPA: helix-turn-helix domain-containing protein [Bacilli bacterium]|nr:helix-turn-helix domain-containing protein [Bacilli bacterium]